MCFGKKLYIKPLYENRNMIVQVSDPFVVTKNTYVTVPKDAIAYLYDHGKRTARLESGKDNRLFKMDKKSLSKWLQVEYILPCVDQQISWELGEIAVRDPQTDEVFHIGANGQCHVKMDPLKLTRVFAINEPITVDKVREKYVTAMRQVGMPVLIRFFHLHPVSIYDINSLIPNLRDEMLSVLRDHEEMEMLGFYVTGLTIGRVHVNLEDLHRIQLASGAKTKGD